MNVKMVFLLEENRPDEVSLRLDLNSSLGDFFVQRKGENVIDRKDGYQRFG